MNLGIRYLTGRGVPSDEALGIAWLEKAAAQGQEQAKSKLTILEELRHRARVRTAMFAALAVIVVVLALIIALRLAREGADTGQRALRVNSSMG
jgi:TPR repeat protein